MFHKRLRTFLVILLVFTGLLTLRALQLQVVGADEWRDRAAKVFAPPAQLIETTRGRILDVRGREIAVDSPCVDLCVDYRAIIARRNTADPLVDKWLRLTAALRLRDRLGEEYTGASRSARIAMADQEVARILADIDAMWADIARQSGKTLEEIDEARRAVVQRVEMRRRYIWVSRWRDAVKTRKSLPEAPWYQRWLMGDDEEGLELESFDLTIGEQTSAHVILPDVPTEVGNYFARRLEAFPGLVLRPGIKRVYPYENAGCHVVGHLAKVTREDLLDDDQAEELRKYWPNDVIGRTGVEALAEPLLRGSRGRVVRRDDEDEEMTEPRPGSDVYVTIDIELQRQLQSLFKHVSIEETIGEKKVTSQREMHGAAVVIDIPTGEVRALASYPDYDVNRYDQEYGDLVRDVLNVPLRNRATQVAREPGSTAKPIIGLGAIGDGISTAGRTIECTGYLVFNGRRYGMGRCWVASRFAHMGINVAHHQIPSLAPHPNGFLNLSDALERSCNVYFETLGDKLGVDGVSKWLRAFGVGRYTDIGIAEVPGYVPADFRDIPDSQRRSTSWFASIGQGKIGATPLQMAGVAATIARDGVWMKPRLLVTGTPLPKRPPTTQRTDKTAPDEDRIDLGLPRDAVRAARDGMKNVVYAPAGTGRHVAHLDGNDRTLEPSLAHIRIAGKTGTATASRIRVPIVDGNGYPVKDATGPRLQPSVPGRDNPQAPWYRSTDPEGKNFNHAWFIGFAPADNPKIAFAVLVEYGGSGGGTAGRLAKRVVEACIHHGYLPAGSPLTQAR